LLGLLCLSGVAACGPAEGHTAAPIASAAPAAATCDTPAACEARASAKVEALRHDPVV